MEERGRLPSGAHRGLIWADLFCTALRPGEVTEPGGSCAACSRGRDINTEGRREGRGSRTCLLDDWNVKVKSNSRLEGRWRLMSEEESVASQRRGRRFIGVTQHIFTMNYSTRHITRIHQYITLRVNTSLITRFIRK